MESSLIRKRALSGMLCLIWVISKPSVPGLQWEQRACVGFLRGWFLFCVFFQSFGTQAKQIFTSNYCPCEECSFLLFPFSLLFLEPLEHNSFGHALISKNLNLCFFSFQSFLAVPPFSLTNTQGLTSDFNKPLLSSAGMSPQDVKD